MAVTENDNGEYSLLRLAPPVLRARDFRLYTRDRRLVDLWQNGGAAVLGHTPPAFFRELKNTASRGLYAPFPHFLEARFIKALRRLFPGGTFRLYASAPAALETLFKEGIAGLWRPFLDLNAPLSVPVDAPQALIPVLPGIQGWRGGLPQGLCALVLASGFENSLSGVSLPPGELLSPVLLAAATRGIYDLFAAAPERAKPLFPRVSKVLNESLWERRGIYLTPREPPAPETWAALFRYFLDLGFLLPPVPAQPAILPGALSPGEEAKLAEALQFTPQKTIL